MSIYLPTSPPPPTHTHTHIYTKRHHLLRLIIWGDYLLYLVKCR